MAKILIINKLLVVIPVKSVCCTIIAETRTLFRFFLSTFATRK